MGLKLTKSLMIEFYANFVEGNSITKLLSGTYRFASARQKKQLCGLVVVAEECGVDLIKAG